MGRIKNPLKVHWSGGVDGLVGYWRFGASYFRSFAQSVANPRTEAQQTARLHFATLSKLMANLNPAYQIGFSKFKGDGQGPRDVASKANYDKITISGDTVTVDYIKVELSRGSTPLPYNFVASASTAEHKVILSWADNTGVYGANSRDAVYCHLLNVTKGEKVFVKAGTRADESAEVTYPTGWAGDTIHIYTFAVNETNDEGSETLHVAQVEG